MMDIEPLLHEMIRRDASDLHLKAGRPPVLRIHGQLAPLDGKTAVSPADLNHFLQQLASEEQQAQFAREHELDFSASLDDQLRFRVNVARQQGSLSFTLRAVRHQIPGFDELGLPAVCAALAHRPQGLVLVTGPAGSGKSTTLAALIESINQTAARRIVTVEDPIEYVFTDRQSIITQREVGHDTHSFAWALKYALRQDPDVIMVGEMRDLETIAATLTAAETGHLVLTTLHTPGAPESIDRMVDVFPARQQQQVRTQLAMTLAGVIAQRLVPRADGNGRIAACEVIVGTSAIRNLIREGKTAQMTNAMQSGRDHGMQTLNQALYRLYRAGRISWDTALAHAIDPNGLKRLLVGSG